MTTMWLAGVALLAAGIYTRSARRSLIVMFAGTLILAVNFIGGWGA